MFLLDTNVVSELRKETRMSGPVKRWVEGTTLSTLFLSSITILEVEIGAQRIRRRDRKQGDQLLRWIEIGLMAAFAGRFIPVDVAVARRSASLHVPDPRPERDALIAGTALVHGLTLVSRNVRDFAKMGVPVVNPFEA
ncbi:MAG: type II toxin-antitoxin system VapC family toxin [Hyphomicrobiaceae bacterium]